MKRLFIAIPFHAEESFLSEWNSIKQSLSRENIKWISEKNLHVTLKFLGETPEDKIPELCSILDQTFSFEPTAIIHWNKIGVFGSSYKQRVLWLGCKEEKLITTLYEKLRLNLENAGIQYDRQNFVPHVSLTRFKKPVDNKRLKTLTEKYNSFPFQESTISKVVLMESKLKPSGAEYHILHHTNFS